MAALVEADLLLSLEALLLLLLKWLPHRITVLAWMQLLSLGLGQRLELGQQLELGQRLQLGQHLGLGQHLHRGQQRQLGQPR